jgi:hypothetical protein
VTFDCESPGRVADFWSAALGWPRKGDTVRDPESTFYLEFVPVPEKKSLKNRLHLGCGAQGDLDTEIERLTSLGATLLWEEEFPEGWSYRNVVLADVEGNEFCLGTEPHSD